MSDNWLFLFYICLGSMPIGVLQKQGITDGEL